MSGKREVSNLNSKTSVRDRLKLSKSYGKRAAKPNATRIIQKTSPKLLYSPALSAFECVSLELRDCRNMYLARSIMT